MDNKIKMERYPKESEEGSFWKYSHEQLPAQSKDFEAIQKLKQAESQLDLMKRRLSALQIKDEKNNRRS